MPKKLQGSEICYTFALANEKNECTRLDSLAQLVEHNTFNVGVLGSSPRRITEKPDTPIIDRLPECRFLKVPCYPRQGRGNQFPHPTRKEYPLCLNPKPES